MFVGWVGVYWVSVYKVLGFRCLGSGVHCGVQVLGDSSVGVEVVGSCVGVEVVGSCVGVEVVGTCVRVEVWLRIVQVWLRFGVWFLVSCRSNVSRWEVCFV